MMSLKNYAKFDEEDIDFLKERLHEISKEYRAYIKGASEALLFVQELREIPIFPDISFEK